MLTNNDILKRYFPNSVYTHNDEYILLEYLQGQGSQALILKAGNELINPMYFVH